MRLHVADCGSSQLLTSRNPQARFRKAQCHLASCTWLANLCLIDLKPARSFELETRVKRYPYLGFPRPPKVRTPA